MFVKSKVIYTKMGRAIRIHAGALVMLRGNQAEVELECGGIMVRVVMSRSFLEKVRSGEKVEMRMLSDMRKELGNETK